MDFEVFEENHSLHIIPQTEQVYALKTLPVTHVELKEDGNKTKVVVTTSMRKLDSGGPMLVLCFCAFLVLASFGLLYVGKDPVIMYSLNGMALLIFTLFFIRMQLGYFDYVRKIRDYVKYKGERVTTDVRRQLFKHKMH